MQMPFNPLPLSTLRKISTAFVPLSYRFRKMFPNLATRLRQANIKIDPQEYMAMMFTLSFFYLIFFAILLTAVLSKITEHYYLLGPTLALIAAFMIMVQISFYPTMRIRKKERDIEKNLIFALRTMLIEIKSGVTLFDAMQLIANSKYGQLSKEFKKAVDEINTGAMYDEALQRLATANPSPYFRKSIWHLVNGMKAGGDIAKIIEETVKSSTRDQRIAIHKFSSQLRMLSLGYLMIGVIMPALLLTFLIVIGSFPQIQISETIFWVILISLIVLQFMYVGMIKSRRPTVMN
ncbi:MAG: type II secretion system F family protein [Candidatus Diapherotrites archaeon]|nr:type II secretion system F family protein [Candidatus Diapherotrites archaeon]